MLLDTYDLDSFYLVSVWCGQMTTGGSPEDHRSSNEMDNDELPYEKSSQSAPSKGVQSSVGWTQKEEEKGSGVRGSVGPPSSKFSVGPPSSGGLQGRLGDGEMNHPLQIRNRSGTDFGVDGTSSPSLTSES